MMIEHCRGFCEVKNQIVEIMVNKQKNTKTKQLMLTPLRCLQAGGCPRTTFCKMVNPLTTRLPVNLDANNDQSVAS